MNSNNRHRFAECGQGWPAIQRRRRRKHGRGNNEAFARGALSLLRLGIVPEFDLGRFRSKTQLSLDLLRDEPVAGIIQ